ncbi:hypothetical protein K466DRAFT_191999 [Polyporus arcularius HHB13444]|uniref:Uncharacterized protein n=1 Tax=Polyporus arcularius HHB13444 TaxID=1314778 RepID=A0A5C3P8U7_9APHY|nr:hypothetical protein K466DRAFT_191999 [Polyporus arcularius HHB13444]
MLSKTVHHPDDDHHAADPHAVLRRHCFDDWASGRSGQRRASADDALIFLIRQVWAASRSTLRPFDVAQHSETDINSPLHTKRRRALEQLGPLRPSGRGCDFIMLRMLTGRIGGCIPLEYCCAAECLAARPGRRALRAACRGHDELFTDVLAGLYNE